MPVMEDVEVIDLEQLWIEDLHCTVPHNPNHCVLRADYELQFNCGHPSYFSCESFRKMVLAQEGLHAWTCKFCGVRIGDCFNFIPI